MPRGTQALSRSGAAYRIVYAGSPREEVLQIMQSELRQFITKPIGTKELCLLANLVV
jgi:hypothetical protein